MRIGRSVPGPAQRAIILGVSPSFRSPFRKPDKADDSDAPDAPATDAGGEWIAYELHAWALEARVMASQLLVADGVVHSWQGTTLTVHESAEEVVDALLEEVQVAGRRSLDPDVPKTAFEMDSWDDDLRDILSERLVGTGVPHEFDGDGDLVIHEIDEEQVDMIIDEVMARHQEHGLERLEGLEANELLSKLFFATDRLSRDPGDVNGAGGVIDHGERLVCSAAPFGFEPDGWGRLRDSTAALMDLIRQEVPPDDDEIVGQAETLRETLRALI